MKILTLFLALLLTMLPESTPCADFFPQGQDSCWELTDDIEEEAVIRTSQGTQKEYQASSRPAPDGPRFSKKIKTPRHSTHHCFERQWLTSCSLRL